jgi:SAM-dependent methyltransferase
VKAAGGGAHAAGVSEELKRSVVAHYESKLRAHGATARGMDWKDEASQRLRFEMLCAIGDLSGQRVHEVGAGAGHLLDYLKERGIAARYSGSDLSEAMVEAARARHPGVTFERRDLLTEVPREAGAGPSLGEGPRAGYDVLLCSGLFHVKLHHPEEAWRAFVQETIRRMYALCRVGIAFNLMSDRVDFRAPSLYYSNPSEMLAFCLRELSRFVVLRHDYPLHEYTVYVYRSAPAPAA